jgi:cathepsin L
VTCVLTACSSYLVFSKNMRPYSGRYYATVQLPDSVDWRTQANVVTPVKEQGKCGSCWAFAATTALETHIALSTGKLFMLSVQELVSCVGNLRDCGGQGGCNGSTAELAYNFIATHGIVEEWVFGYQSFDGQNVTCTLLGNETTAGEESVFRGAFAMEERSLARNQSSTNIKGAVASILGFANLPTNNYYSLIHAVATHGPVVVNIACADWRLYSHGIFDDDKATDRNINHVVVAEGYGTDQETGQDYWLVRNSWGPLWGKIQQHVLFIFDYCSRRLTPRYNR